MTGQWDHSIAVRDVTVAEIEFFFEHGWVHVPGLISRKDSAMLLARGEQEFGGDGRAGLGPATPLDPDAPSIPYRSWFRSLRDPTNDACIGQVAHAPNLGKNAARLLGHDRAIRLTTNALTVKLPGGGEDGRATDFHQDLSGHSYISENFLTVWVALDEVRPDMGSMQFYSGSHKLGNLGRMSPGNIWDGFAPHVERACALTEPVHFQPGDATFHAGGTIHGTGINRGSLPRWSWIAVLVPGDAPFTGASQDHIDMSGVEVGGNLDPSGYPVIYRPAC